MSEHSRFDVTILFEEELRLAAKAFRAFGDSVKDQGEDDPMSEESKELLWKAVEVGSAALWDADKDRPLILTRAADIRRRSNKEAR